MWYTAWYNTWDVPLSNKTSCCRAVPLRGGSDTEVRMGSSESLRAGPPAESLDVTEAARSSDAPFVVVGVGASAGGLEALSDLLANLPANTGMAVVVVQHLDPQHESMLSNLLSRATNVPVLEAEQGLAVSPDHVYVIPKNTTMTIAQGVLHLAPRDGTNGPHMPIDLFLKSLAKDRRSEERRVGKECRS